MDATLVERYVKKYVHTSCTFDTWKDTYIHTSNSCIAYVNATRFRWCNYFSTRSRNLASISGHVSHATDVRLIGSSVETPNVMRDNRLK